MKNEKGITLIALVATIILMVILAGVVVTGVRDGGIFHHAARAKLSTEEASKREGIMQSFVLAASMSKTGKVKVEELQKALDDTFEKDYAEAIDSSEQLIVRIEGKFYELDKNGNVGQAITIEPITGAGDITRGNTCTGTQSNPYRIECIEDLVKLSMMAYKDQTLNTSKYYLVTRDLDFDSIFSYSNYKAKYSYVEADNAYEPDENSETTIKELCTTGKGFIPIGLEYGNSGSTKVFRGTFYGEEPRTIKNIYINTSNNAALFGGVGNSKIMNITIDGNIKSTAKGAAGLVASANYITIEKCYNKATITGKGASGIFGGGLANITIKECGNEGKIIAEGGTGAGIACNAVETNKCYNTGEIINSNGPAVGICGRSIANNPPTIKNCYNLGNVTSNTGSAGGISYWFPTTLSNCLNCGKISGKAITSCGVARYIPSYQFIYGSV